MEVVSIEDIRELLVLNQFELKNYVYEYLNSIFDKDKITNMEEYVYAEGDIPVLLVAHLDTVHKSKPDTILFDEEQQMLWSPQGIGGDDRCGVYAILQILKNYKPYVLFPTNEEIGGLGTQKFVEDFETLPVNFIIEIDRRGVGQSVYYNCGNETFKFFIDSLGFEENYGSFSDISILSPAYDIASVNLSAGYYNEHTNEEFINLNHLKYTRIKIEGLLKAMQDEENQEALKFDYQEKKYYTTLYDDFSYYSKNNKHTDDVIKLFQDDFENMTNADWFYYYGFRKPAKFKQAKKLLYEYGFL